MDKSLEQYDEDLDIFVHNRNEKMWEKFSRLMEMAKSLFSEGDDDIYISVSGQRTAGINSELITMTIRNYRPEDNSSEDFTKRMMGL